MFFVLNLSKEHKALVSGYVFSKEINQIAFEFILSNFLLILLYKLSAFNCDDS